MLLHHPVRKWYKLSSRVPFKLVIFTYCEHWRPCDLYCLVTYVSFYEFIYKCILSVHEHYSERVVWLGIVCSKLKCIDQFYCCIFYNHGCSFRFLLVSHATIYNCSCLVTSNSENEELDSLKRKWDAIPLHLYFIYCFWRKNKSKCNSITSFSKCRTYS